MLFIEFIITNRGKNCSYTLFIFLGSFSFSKRIVKFESGFLGSVAVHLSEQHVLNATLDFSIVRKSGAPSFKPGAAG